MRGLRGVRTVLSSLTLMVMSSQAAQAAINLDRTRIIYNAGERSVAVNIRNDNELWPFLAQAWLEDLNGKRLETGPLVVTPPLQRLEAKGKSLVRIQATPGVNSLPQDRESVFWFNLREVPPDTGEKNVLRLAFQTRVKLFWRPEGIQVKSDEPWQNRLVLHRRGNEYRVENPTPYYITVTGAGNSEKEAQQSRTDGLMVPPLSDRSTVKVSGNTPWLIYVNDWGGYWSLQFRCEGDTCRVADSKRV